MKQKKTKNIVQIRFFNPDFNTSENNKNVIDLFNSIIDKAISLDIWNESIKAIIITDDFTNEIEKQASIWNIKTSISKEKEYSVVSKTLFNNRLDNPEYHIFFRFQNYYHPSFPFYQMVIKQIVNIYANKIIPIEIRKYKIKNQPSSLEDYVTFASTEWCKAYFVKNYMNNLSITPILSMDHNSFMIAFKRSLKKNLFDYNSDKYERDKHLNIFWQTFFESINTLFLRLIEYEKNDIKIKNDEPSKDLIYKVIFEIEELTKRCLKNDKYDVTLLKDAIKNFTAHFEVFLEDESEDGFRIRLTKNPKDYFIDEIVETEPRIICFMDILGFSELINEYDTDITSTVLQDIQESFALAKNQLLENKSLANTEALRHLKYQTFSDNICISIPYFDNENDFLTNFNILSVYVRAFQLIMMSKGIYMRGGISTGSYYADNNIIFSKGLVNAYYLESKKAIYPRVIIDNKIIQKILLYNHLNIRNYGLDHSIIFDWENTAFLKPFGLHESFTKQLESTLNDLDFGEGDNISMLMNSLTKSVSDMSIYYSKTISEQEESGLIAIKNNIFENIHRHNSNENILSKYLWLLEFIKWLEKDKAGKLQFQSLSERLSH